MPARDRSPAATGISSAVARPNHFKTGRASRSSHLKPPPTAKRVASVDKIRLFAAGPAATASITRLRRSFRSYPPIWERCGDPAGATHGHRIRQPLQARHSRGRSSPTAAPQARPPADRCPTPAETSSHLLAASGAPAASPSSQTCLPQAETFGRVPAVTTSSFSPRGGVLWCPHKDAAGWSPCFYLPCQQDTRHQAAILSIPLSWLCQYCIDFICDLFRIY